ARPRGEASGRPRCRNPDRRGAGDAVDADATAVRERRPCAPRATGARPRGGGGTATSGRGPRPPRPAPPPGLWSIPRRDDAPIATRRPPRADDVGPAVRPAPGDARVATPSAPDGASPAPARPAAPGAAAGTGGGDLKALTAKISLQVLTWSPEP